MSDEVKHPIKQFNVGIVAPRSFNDLQLLENTLLEKIFYIAHIYSNGVVSGGKTVEKFAESHRIPITVFPIHATNGGVFKSNREIVLSSDFIYILDDKHSKNVVSLAEECKKQQKKFKIIEYVPETVNAKQTKLIKKIEDICKEQHEDKAVALQTILELIEKHNKSNEQQDQTVSV